MNLKEGWWGYKLMIVEDPDGNQLYFPYSAEREQSNVAMNEVAG